MSNATIANKVNNSKNSNFEILKQYLAKFTNSVWPLVILTVVSIACWAVKLPHISLALATIFTLLDILYSGDPKIFIFCIFASQYMLTSIYGLFNWIFCGVCAVTFVACIVAYVIIQKIKYKKTFTKGKLFWVFLISCVGDLLAGVVGHFEVVNFFLVALGLCIVYGLYWYSLNFIKDYKKHFAYYLIFLSLIIVGEVFVCYLQADSIIDAIKNKSIYVGTDEINSAATYIILGVAACFYLAIKRPKRDYLYIALALFFDVAIFFTHCRMALFVTFIITVAYFIVFIRKSPNRKGILISLGIILALAVIACLIFWQKLYDFVSYYINYGFNLNGRGKLWPWCWQQFKENPIFGIGYITRDAGALAGNYPGLRDVGGGFSFVYAHNFFLHYLTCSGLVGLLLNIPLHFKICCLFIKKQTKFKTFCLMNLIALFVSSLFDLTLNMSIFCIIIPFIMSGLLENDDCSQEVEQPTGESNDDKNNDEQKEKDDNNFRRSSNKQDILSSSN